MTQTIILLTIGAFLAIAVIVLAVNLAAEKNWSKHLAGELKRSYSKMRILEAAMGFIADRAVLLLGDEKRVLQNAREHTQLADEVQRDFETFGEHKKDLDGCEVVVNQELCDKLRAQASQAFDKAMELIKLRIKGMMKAK